jgi:hypothetical protein
MQVVCGQLLVKMIVVAFESNPMEPAIFSSSKATTLSKRVTCSLFASADDDGDTELIAMPLPTVTYTLVHPIAHMWSTCDSDGVCNCSAKLPFPTLNDQRFYEAMCQATSSVLAQAPTFVSSGLECRIASNCSMPFIAPLVPFASLGCKMHTYYAFVHDGPSLARLAVACDVGGSDCQCEVVGVFAVAGTYKVALQLLAAGGTDGEEVDEFGHFLPVRFRVAPQVVEVVVTGERPQQQQQLLRASSCKCDLTCTHSGTWIRYDQSNTSVSSLVSSENTASDTVVGRGVSAARCDDGRGMKWVNSCESSCCYAHNSSNATCLHRANTTLLVLGFSHERTLWFDMMYRFFRINLVFAWL